MDTFEIVSGHRIGLFVLSLGLLLLIIELVRRDLLKERFALLWLATGLLGLTIGIFPGLISALARVLHFQILTALFAMAFVFTLAVILGYSVIISRLTERNRALVQEVALLSQAIDRLREEKKDD